MLTFCPSTSQGEGFQSAIVCIAVISALPEKSLFRKVATFTGPSQAVFEKISSSDGLDGLGYNSNNNPGVCPVSGLSQAHYEGSPIVSGYPGHSATDAANVRSEERPCRERV